MKNCASCQIELTSSALIRGGQAFCCSGCEEGGPCGCSYEDVPVGSTGNGHADPIVTWALLGGTLNEGNHDGLQ
jgi:hypothetical protein